MLLWGGGRQGRGHPQKLTGQLSQVSTVENRKGPRPKQRRGKGPTPLSSTPCFVCVCFHVQTWILHTCTPASNQTENNNNSSTLSCWQRGKMWRPSNWGEYRAHVSLIHTPVYHTVWVPQSEACWDYMNQGKVRTVQGLCRPLDIFHTHISLNLWL